MERLIFQYTVKKHKIHNMQINIENKRMSTFKFSIHKIMINP